MAMAKSSGIPLSNLKPGESGRVLAIEGDIRQKLYLRGLFEGCVVRVISRFPVILEVDGRAIAVGRGVAKKIIVERIIKNK